MTSVEPSCWRNRRLMAAIFRAPSSTISSCQSPACRRSSTVEAMCCSSGRLIFFARWRLETITVGRRALISGPTLRRRCSFRFFAPVFLIRREDFLHEWMAHYIASGKFHDGNAFDAFEHPMGFEQAGMFVRRQINLRLIARDDGLGTVAQACEKHQHLLGSGILGLVQNDEGIVQRAPAHVG